MCEQYQSKQRGIRAEEVTSWYFRLNGFLTIPGFVVHPDQCRRFPRTEADIIGVRFPFSRECISYREMVDDRILTDIDKTGHRTVFVLVEVKADLCDINGPWSDPQEGNMNRVICRLGFSDSTIVDAVAAQMYDSARWEDERYVLQYICVGKRKNDGRQRQFPDLLQIDWSEIANFLWERFKDFPEKLPDGQPVHAQWPEFGRKYGEWFASEFVHSHEDEHHHRARSLSAIAHYIKAGTCASEETPNNIHPTKRV